MKNLNTITTNAHNSKASRCTDQTLFDWWTNLKLKTLQCSNNKKWKFYFFDKKESMGKERTWECEEKMHKEQEINPKINLRKIVQ